MLFVLGKFAKTSSHWLPKAMLLFLHITLSLHHRGSAAATSPGNLRFRAKIKSILPEYADCKSKLSKSMLVSKVVDSVRDALLYFDSHQDALFDAAIAAMSDADNETGE